MNPPARTLGELMHGLRQRNKWTLKEMSSICGIPYSTLAKVEHGRLTLTYDKLQQISQRLGIGMSDLFAESACETGDSQAVVTARRSIGSIKHAIRVNTPNYDYYYLCPELRRKRMVPVVVRVGAKSLKEFGELVRHCGEEFIYVLKGRVAVHTEFYDPMILGSGESVYIDSDMGHAYVTADGYDEATILAVCSSAEERLMESLIELHGPQKRKKQAAKRG